jgi:hypothetical protein
VKYLNYLSSLSIFLDVLSALYSKATTFILKKDVLMTHKKKQEKTPVTPSDSVTNQLPVVETNSIEAQDTLGRVAQRIFPFRRSQIRT